MLGELTTDQIEELLQSEVIGRIGCQRDGRVYIVPVTYAYHDGFIYGHSGDGLKVEMLRSNPSMCFEVEHIDDVANWRTVIGWGHYEELYGADALAGLQLLVNRLVPLMTSATAQPSHGLATDAAASRSKGHGTDTVTPGVVIYRVLLTEKNGRYEMRHAQRQPEGPRDDATSIA
jgi:uncharacterized protein